MSKKITLENVDSSELPEIPVIGEVKQIRFTQDMELVSTLADSDLFMIQAGADLEARPNTITFDLIIKNLSGPIEEGSKKFVTGDMMFKVIGDMNLLDTWDNTNLVNSLNATYVNVRRIEEELRREINRSTGKDEQHDEQIANLRQDLTSTNEMLNQEINRSVAKDKEHDELLEGLRDDVYSISSKLDAEIDRSTAKDAEHDTLLKGLRVDVNANKSAIESEVARSTARDEDHDAAISKNASDIATETSRAKAEEAKIQQEMKTADTNLQNAITAETERATGVEEDLQRQITDLSGSTDDRLEALEALSHEQNTDTGTTSKTFVIDSGNTGAMLKAEGGGLSTRTKGDAGYANFTVQNLVIKGDVTQEGDTFITQAERVEVRDNMILINEGETGVGVTAGFAGIEVDRGTEQNFMFGFNESDGMFKIGKEGNMFDVALRQPVGDMIDGMFASWDAATKTFKTTNLIPPTLQLYLGVPEVSIKYLSSDDGSIKFMTNGMGWSAFTSSMYTNFRSDRNKFQFIGELGVSTGIYDTIDENFTIRTKGTNVLLLNKSKSVLNSSLTATSFFRSSDDAEVLYATDQTSLTDGMFLSWDATNNKVVTTNMVPKGTELYIGDKDVSIKYYDDSGRKSVVTYTGKGYFYVRSSEKTFTSFGTNSPQGFQFLAPIESSTGKINSLTDNLTLGTIQGSGRIKLYIGESSYITTPFSAVTFKRSSDDSEVLYQADLKSVLTGKETNYAPTVKAVSDAIDAVNTGTTESLKNYLKLSGGTMTGSIRIVDTGSASSLTGILNNDGTKALLFTYLKESENRWGVGTKEYVGVIRSNVSDLIHMVNNNGTLSEYSIYDKRNLPDPATKSGNNAFTGTNSFVGGKFSVNNFKVMGDSTYRIAQNYSDTTVWARGFEMFANDVRVGNTGFKGIGGNSEYYFIGVGNNIEWDTSQYIFYNNRIKVPDNFSLTTNKGYGIVNFSRNEYTNDMLFGSNEWGVILCSNDTDINHLKKGTIYKIWDASNLPTPASTSDIPDVSDMARRSEANTFTASNTFTAGQFNVGAFEIDANNNIFVNISQESGWARELVFINSSSATNSVRYGVSGSTKVANYAYIGIGDVDYDSAQYKFTPSRLIVPATWSLIDEATSGEIILFGSENQYFGRNRGTTYIRSGNTDLYHTKVSTSYKILDESNYSQYLPTTSKWTYGFVYEPKKVYDLNTDLVGPDKGKLAYNYTRPSYWTNGPTGMDYGTVIQIWGSGSSASTPSLMPQLAFDVNHDVANSTRYMYFRTANNLGYGDSSNWKRVVTADEGVAVLVMDANTYPSIARIDGTTYNWLRTPAQGLLPNTPVTLADGGISYLGTSYWSFQRAYISNVYANNHYFGSSGTYLSGDANYAGVLNNGAAKGMKVGSLLVSSNYASTKLVPTNGIFSSGIIRSNDSMLVGYTRDITGGQLGYGLYCGGVSDVGLGSEYSSGALILYKFVNPNIGSLGYNVPRASSGIPTYLKIMDGSVKLGVGARKAYTAGEAVTMTEYTLATLDAVNTKLGSYLPTSGGTVSGSLTISPVGSSGFAVNNANTSGVDVIQTFRVKGTSKFLLGWSESGGGAFIQRSDNNRCMILMSDGLYTGSVLGSTIRVATLTDLGGYLPLAGGTMTGKLTINTSTTNPLAINHTNAAANEVYIQIQRAGTALAAIGNMPSNGSYIYNYAADKYLFVGNDGCYFGTPSSNAKLLTTADNVITVVGGVNYVNVSLSEAAKASAGAAKYLEWYDATPGWYNFRLGSVTANGDVVSTGSFFSQTNKLLKYVHNSTTHSAISVNKKDGNGYLMVGNYSSMMRTYLLSNNSDIVHYRGTDGSSSKGYIMWDAYNLPSPATQSWVTSQGYLTSITKSMVTTALGYTPPTTNTTYSQATSSTLGLVKIGATGLASKNYAVQLNSSGQMYVAVPWTDTNTTYSAATSSTYGLVKIGATGLAAKNYAVQLNSSGQMYVAVPWTDTDTNTHYTTRLYAGASGTAANSATTSPYIKVTDDDTYRNQIRLLGGGATSVSSDASGNITITSTNTTYSLATSSSNGLMSSSQYTKLSNCIETVSATDMVTSVQVVDTIPASSSQVTGRLYLKFA